MTDQPKPWTVAFRDDMWEVTCSDGSLAGRFPREGDALTFADVAGPGLMTIVSSGRLDELTVARNYGELLADAVEDYVFTEERDLDRLRAAWQLYVEKVDGRAFDAPSSSALLRVRAEETA